jgi:two-component system, OmpR family, sensor histidine kinase KdpD
VVWRQGPWRHNHPDRLAPYTPLDPEAQLGKSDATDQPRRPTAEELLQRYHLGSKEEHAGRGSLRVFLGAAPNVGKTYAMLNEGRRLRAEGHDVVVGFIEPHGRPETEAQIGDLEVIPRARIPYRGVMLDDMDTDAILARKPEIVLVDELAHTNAPGSGRAKRYEDVQFLRDSGIDVITTLNIQHLDSLQDVIAGITGIEVRETIPDRVLEDADVQLVDLPSDALIERLRQGKVYPPQRAQQALQHFFRPGNLTALREMALRQTAAGVDDDLTGYMHEHRIEEIWPAAERVMVLVDGDAAAGAVVRTAWRLASALRGELVAGVLTPPGGRDRLPVTGRRVLERNILLAEDLGARVRLIEAANLAQAIADAVRDEHATLVVMRHIRKPGWRRMFDASLVDELLDLLDNVDLHIVETSPGNAADIS